MSNEKPIIAGDASKAEKHAAPDAATLDKNSAAKTTVEPSAKPADSVKKS